MQRDGQYLWTLIGTALLIPAPGQPWLLSDIIPADDKRADPAEHVAWCPIADNPARAYRLPGGQFCYATYSVQLEWQEAVEFCSQKGGSLALLNGHEQHSASMYFKLFRQLKTDQAYVGLSEQDGQWQLLDGSPMGSYDLFTDDFIEQLFSWYDCGILIKIGTPLTRLGYELSRRSCTYKMYFICQQAIPSNETTAIPDELTVGLVTSPVAHQRTGHPITTTTTDRTYSTVLSAVTNPVNSTTAYQSPKNTTIVADTSPPSDSTYPTVTSDLGHTATTTGKLTASGPLRKKPQRTTKSRKPLVTRKRYPGTFLSGNPVFHVRVFAVTMCARICGQQRPVCRLVNYNVATKECAGFTILGNLDTENKELWDVWALE